MGKWLRRVGLALLCSLLAGFALGTCLRKRAERPTVYLGAAPPAGPARSPEPDAPARTVAEWSRNILL